MLEGRIVEYLSDPFYADIEVFFDLYWHRNDPIPSCDPKDTTGFLDGNDGYYYLSEPCVQYAIRCRAEDNAALHLPANAEKIIQKYNTTKWDDYQLFSLLFPLWWGMREKQIRAIQGYYPKKYRWRAINYFLCHPEEDALPKDGNGIRCVFKGKYLKETKEEFPLEGVWVDAPEWILRTVELADK